MGKADRQVLARPEEGAEPMSRSAPAARRRAGTLQPSDPRRQGRYDELSSAGGARESGGRGETCTEFTCTHCGRQIPVEASGTRNRNHCPHCLWSLHVDVRPGDRAHLCRSPMAPIALWVLSDGEQRIIHRCTRCCTLKANRVAGDDCEETLANLTGSRQESGQAAARPPVSGGLDNNR